MSLKNRFQVSAVFVWAVICYIRLRLVIFLKDVFFFSSSLRQQSVFILFFSSLFFLSPSYGQRPPSIPFEETPSPQSLLPLEDLIPDFPSTQSDSSASSSSRSGAILLDDYALQPHSHQSLASDRKEQEIVRLLKELKYCSNAKEAKNLSRQLQRLWSRSGNETIDLLMTWAEQSIIALDYGAALDRIDSVISLAPTYAEPWVKRAWIHIQLSDFKLAMFDLSHALRLEPRHYIAFLELGIIMEETNRPHLAIKAYETALSFYPQMQFLHRHLDFLVSQQLDQEV
ncbi:hypothetical protein [Bartonella sp. AR 15-3]|uniref:tetratricopeptide repeat protein n=1 Tax=Bartonella sp. AR 15-3 TaxID=545617 RepID=UPI0001F4BA17|nr:hypothetical protein [Bartonella sp. AR 15-3]OPB32200.1 Tetratricopeptide repeat-containing protein [Bartonella sp. AR 15-3]CBI79851.1 conserved hypothetical protein [Bartonella sp. AR 15-3]